MKSFTELIQEELPRAIQSQVDRIKRDEERLEQDKEKLRSDRESLKQRGMIKKRNDGE